MSCHVVPSVTHKLRNVYEMRDTECHARALNNYVVTSRDTLEKLVQFAQFATTWLALLHLAASPRIPTHSVTSSSLIGTQTVCRASVRLAW